MVILLVFLGGGVGSVCRYAVGGLLQSRSVNGFPVGTLVVNVIGCVVVGVLAKYFLHSQAHLLTRTALIVGFCGGFTTFSTFSFETVELATTRRPLLALTYIVSSLLLCVLGTAAGYGLFPIVNR